MLTRQLITFLASATFSCTSLKLDYSSRLHAIAFRWLSAKLSAGLRAPHNNYVLLEMTEQEKNFRLPLGWCSDCRAAAARPCWDEHAVLNAKAAERYLSREQVPAGALQEAAALLQDVQCQGEQ
ncbi:Methionine--tRNA ligase, mitochondrial, partial [Frankliniella fusca]